ncbi:MAG: glycosyl transferase [Bacteroidetes bacterium MED-G20]|nr:MAG: glycosyl transferase [Bacteroidetes bacterium MED-G20]
MKISIITVCYNSQETIKDTIESVINQSYDNIEYIIIDGNSNDNTCNIINSYSNIDIFISENDKGIYDAINKGIKRASGEIIGLLHADDVFDNHQVIEKVISNFSSNKDILYGDINYVKKNNLNQIVRKWRSGNYSSKKFKWGWMPPHTGFFLKRKCYINFGLYRLDLGSSADYELMLRMFEVHKLSSFYLPINIVKMRVGGISNSSFKNRWTANKNDKKSWKVNSLNPGWCTFVLKPIIKLKQFI